MTLHEGGLYELRNGEICVAGPLLEFGRQRYRLTNIRGGHVGEMGSGNYYVDGRYVGYEDDENFELHVKREIMP